MQIPASQVSYKKKIGYEGSSPVWAVGTIGGLHLVIIAKGGSFETAGTGPHCAIARFIAQKKYPNIEFTELAKSEQLDPASFQDLVPTYEGITDQIRSAQGLK